MIMIVLVTSILVTNDYYTTKFVPCQVRTPTGKTRITIRLDNEILAWFRKQVNIAGGGNYQTLINNALRTYIEQQEEPLEEILRRVVREEIQRAA
jgi:hypothetical protein